MKNHRHIFHNFLLYSVFAFYLLVLIALLFMNRYSFRSINIVPFRTIINYLLGSNLIIRSFALSNVLGNIVLFIPLGIYLTLFNRDKRIYKNVLWIFLISLSVEILQYIFMIGVSDIDDVILNCVGGFIGITVYRVLLLKLKDLKKVRYSIEILAPIGGIVSFFILFIYNHA